MKLTTFAALALLSSVAVSYGTKRTVSRQENTETEETAVEETAVEETAVEETTEFNPDEPMEKEEGEYTYEEGEYTY
jgi:hypothetical protein